MSETANAQHCDEIASLRRRVAQRAERRQAGAQQRRGSDRIKIIRHRHETAGFRDHHFGIAAIMLHAGVGLVLATHEITVPARQAMAAAAAKEANSDSLAHCPSFNAVAQRIDPTDSLVARNTRPLDRKQTFNGRGVRMAHPAGLHTDTNMAWQGIGERLFCQLQFAWTYRLSCTICRCGLSHIRLRRCSSWRTHLRSFAGQDSRRHETN
jgi:hypothetical protein